MAAVEADGNRHHAGMQIGLPTNGEIAVVRKIEQISSKWIIGILAMDRCRVLNWPP